MKKIKVLVAVALACGTCALKAHPMWAYACRGNAGAKMKPSVYVADGAGAAMRVDTLAASSAASADSTGSSSVEDAIFGNKADDNVPSFDLYTKILDKSHRYQGDAFSKGIFDHLGLTIGAGVEQVSKPSDGYRLTPLTTVSVGLQKDFTPLHSLRFLYTFGFGYQKGKDLSFKESMGSLDYIFNLSSYYDGYRPDRRLSVSPFIGVGVQNARLGAPAGVADHAVDGHVGLQLKFYAGNKATFSIEPMVKIASDTYDVSGDQNWRRYDVVYGGNMLFTYYFKNNLSKGGRLGDFRHDYDRGLLYRRDDGRKTKLYGHDLYEEKARQVSDSVHMAKEMKGHIYDDDAAASTWRSPVFFDIAGGVSSVKTDNFSSGETMGTSVAFSAGKWFSSFIGVRAAGHIANGKWSEAYEEATAATPAYKQNLYATYVGGELEGMFNLLGLGRRYNWQSPAGVTLLAGVGYGRMMKYDETRLECDYVSYKAGAQIWMRLSDDLRLFVEPEYRYYSYKIPYSNVKWNKKFGDKEIAVRMGVSVLMNALRHKETAADQQDDEAGRFVVGLGGGMNQVYRKSMYQWGSGNALNFNAAAYGYYMFNHVHGAQLNVQFISNTENTLTTYQDHNPTYGITLNRQGLWKRTFYVLMPSLNYKLSLTEAMSGHSPRRRCDLDFLVGPAMALRMGESDDMSPEEHATGGNQRRIADANEFGSYFGVNAGFNLKVRASKKIGIFAMPMFYYFGSADVFRSEALTFKKTVLMTFNMGVQYKL